LTSPKVLSPKQRQQRNKEQRGGGMTGMHQNGDEVMTAKLGFGK